MSILFDCASILSIPQNELQEILVKYKVALQLNKQPLIWKTLCDTFIKKFNGDVRNLFFDMNYEVAAIKEDVQKTKKSFPYLG